MLAFKSYFVSYNYTLLQLVGRELTFSKQKEANRVC
jgi:hypothetical protein